MADRGHDNEIATWLGEAVLRAFRIRNRFENCSVIFVGDLPYWKADLISLLPSTVDLTLEDLPRDISPDYVVIGQQEGLTAELDRCIDVAGNSTRFLPQEGFLDALLFDIDWWSDQATLLNAACDYYLGLAYVRERYEELSFTWPTVVAAPAPEVRGADSRQRALETELHQRGYNVSKKMSRAMRWAVLTRLIDTREMSLRDVAGTIASHCRNRRRRHDGEAIFERALGEWEYDLSRLKVKYYDGHRPSFTWPRTR